MSLTLHDLPSSLERAQGLAASVASLETALAAALDSAKGSAAQLAVTQAQLREAQREAAARKDRHRAALTRAQLDAEETALKRLEQARRRGGWPHDRRERERGEAVHVQLFITRHTEPSEARNRDFCRRQTDRQKRLQTGATVCVGVLTRLSTCVPQRNEDVRSSVLREVKEALAQPQLFGASMGNEDGARALAHGRQKAAADGHATRAGAARVGKAQGLSSAYLC